MRAARRRGPVGPGVPAGHLRLPILSTPAAPAQIPLDSFCSTPRQVRVAPSPRNRPADRVTGVSAPKAPLPADQPAAGPQVGGLQCSLRPLGTQEGGSRGGRHHPPDPNSYRPTPDPTPRASLCVSVLGMGRRQRSEIVALPGGGGWGGCGERVLGVGCLPQRRCPLPQPSL
ncbi:uncharacterized protein LOC121473281 isoform X2 [Vulpes lagopus]|uniref:uncharacterized protein LOC121473281 isoform X2 n=1 Tax=Vulpes lagopus TaxID=494514 RepID=UPI001BCA1DDA|nr:uncharacterized protein LOC121473281 isoform X2 [Vulpes lagopus]